MSRWDLGALQADGGAIAPGSRLAQRDLSTPRQRLPMAVIMWRGHSGWSVLLLGMALGASTSAHARSARKIRAESAAAPVEAEAPVIEAPPTVEWTRTRDPQILNTGEMLSLVKTYATQIAGALVEGEQRREVAVRERDAIKLSCIQDRLSSMKLMKKLSDDRLAATDRPSIRADELNLRHEFRGVEMAHERVLQLQRELVECVGENLEVGTGGDPTQVPATSMGAVDPTGPGVETQPVDRPSPASTYM